jgi:kynurenine formamidase
MEKTQSSAAKLLGGTRLVDCTHTIDASAFTFIGCHPGVENLSFDIHLKQQLKLGFHDTKFKEYTIADTREDPTKSGFKKSLYVMACDVGTHIDSPAHWFANTRGID